MADTFPPPGNLILNGGFDNGFSGWQGTYGLENHAISPAPLSGNTVGIVDGGQNPMYQTFATQPGQTYFLQFYARTPDLGNNGIPIEGLSAAVPSSLTLLLSGSIFNGGPTFESLSIQNRTYWSNYTETFVATSAQTTLSFEVRNGTDDTFMDNVSVTSAPDTFSTLKTFCLLSLLVAGCSRLYGKLPTQSHLDR